MSAPLIPQAPKGPFLLKATRRELLMDAGVRGILMVVVAVLMLKLRNPMSGRVFWPILIGVESLIFVPLLLTIILRRASGVRPPTAEKLTRHKAFERSANFQAVWVTILACSLSYYVVLNGWIAFLPYTMILPLILLWKSPPKSNG